MRFPIDDELKYVPIFRWPNGEKLIRNCILLSLLSFWMAAVGPAEAFQGRFSTPDKIISWINDYRKDPSPTLVPLAVQSMQKLGLFKDQDKAGFLIGFIAGALANNQVEAEILIGNILPLPPKDQTVIIMAIAYSGLPEWRSLLLKFKDKMPLRHHLINQYLAGEKKTLKQLPLDTGPEVLDTLWGYYAATGYYEPVVQIIGALQWSKSEKDSKNPGFKGMFSALSWSKDKKIVDKVTIGNMAKWTLASNAERDRDLIDLYKIQIKHQSKAVKPALQEVINSSERFEADELRKDALSAIQEVKRRNPEGKPAWSTASYAGSLAISTACVVAGATGHVEIAAPCVISGALYSGVVKLFSATQ